MTIEIKLTEQELRHAAADYIYKMHPDLIRRPEAKSIRIYRSAADEIVAYMSTEVST